MVLQPLGDRHALQGRVSADGIQRVRRADLIDQIAER